MQVNDCIIYVLLVELTVDREVHSLVSAKVEHKVKGEQVPAGHTGSLGHEPIATEESSARVPVTWTKAPPGFLGALGWVLV